MAHSKPEAETGNDSYMLMYLQNVDSDGNETCSSSTLSDNSHASVTEAAPPGMGAEGGVDCSATGDVAGALGAPSGSDSGALGAPSGSDSGALGAPSNTDRHSTLLRRMQNLKLGSGKKEQEPGEFEEIELDDLKKPDPEQDCIHERAAEKERKDLRDETKPQTSKSSRRSKPVLPGHQKQRVQFAVVEYRKYRKKESSESD